MRTVFIIITCLCFVACSPGDEIPKDVLPVNTMKTIIWDMAVADQVTVNKSSIKGDSLRISATSNYQKVFAIHKINKKTFYDSYAFYEGNPKFLKILYDSVISYGNHAKTATYKKLY